jgi:deoxyribonuclease (pyrimidine dimer)
MTRINSAIQPGLLTDQHLLAEHREIKRICDNYHKRLIINKFDDIPKEFQLGTGHVLFFINKPLFTLRRYISIHNECLLREFNVSNYIKNWNIYNNSRFENIDHNPTHREWELLVNRIIERLTTGKVNWTWNGIKITVEQASLLLRNEKTLFQ